MTTREALEYARQRLDSISYHLECTDHLPCRSFYEKQEGMLVQAIWALEEKAKRDEKRGNGCEYCISPTVTNSFGRKFYKSCAGFYGTSQGEICLAHDKDGWFVHYEDENDTGIMCDAPAAFCPHCGRAL